MTPMPNAVSALANYQRQNPGLANGAAYSPGATADVNNLMGRSAMVRDSSAPGVGAPQGMGASQQGMPMNAAQLLGTASPQQFSAAQRALAQHLANQNNYAAGHIAYANTPQTPQGPGGVTIAGAQFDANGNRIMPPTPAASVPGPQPGMQGAGYSSAATPQGAAGGAANAQGLTPQAAVQGPNTGMAAAAPLPGGGNVQPASSLPAGTVPSPQVQALTAFQRGGGIANPNQRMTTRFY